MIIDNPLGGKYIVGDKIFYDKISAIIHANHTLADIEWDYGNHIFYSLDWTKEPDTSLDELYRQRALQLREKYDYIIVFCSGGADSINVLYSFLKNDIKVDEVYAGAPLSAIDETTVNKSDLTAANTGSETVLTQIPILKKVQSEYTDLKITINDYVDTILSYREDDWMLTASDWMHPSTRARYSLEKFTHIKKLVESGKKVACIYGSNKPNVVLLNHNFICNIDDIGINVARPAFDDLPCSLEAFYTTPDFPLIAVKQAHAVINYAVSTKNEYLLNIMRIKAAPAKVNYNNRPYENAIIPAIYPSLDYKYFQTDKPNYALLADMDAWLYDLLDGERQGQMFYADISNFRKSINLKYFNGVDRTYLRQFKISFFIANEYQLNTAIIYER